MQTQARGRRDLGRKRLFRCAHVYIPLLVTPSLSLSLSLLCGDKERGGEGERGRGREGERERERGGEEERERGGEGERGRGRWCVL